MIKIFKIINNNQKKNLIFLFFLSLIGMALETFGIGMVIPLITIIAEPDIFYNFNDFTKKFIKFNLKYEELVIYSFLIFFIFYILKTIFLSFLVYFQSKFIYSLKENLSNKLYFNYLNKNYLFHISKNSSELIRNVSLEVMYFGFAMISATNIMIEILVFSGIIFLLLLFEPTGSLFVLIFFSILFMVFYKVIRRKTNEWGEERQYRDGKILQNLQQGLGAIKDVILLSKEKYFLEEYKVHNRRSKILDIIYNLFQNLPKILIELLAVAALFFVIFISIFFNQREPLEIITFLSVFAAGALRLLPSVNRIFNNFQTYKYYQPSVDILEKNLRELANDKILASNSKNLFNNFQKLSISELFFSYPGTDKLLFNNLNLEIQKGEMVGIIGDSGSGKSTLINIIMGLINTSKGYIKVNNININDDIKGWQKKIGYVPQGIYLTDDTIEKNIAFGCFENEINKDKIKSCLKLSQLDGFVETLKFKSKTLVGERGTKLSGGQIQRIGIARALYNNCEIMLFDEATNALDSKTEDEIINSINMFKQNRTIILISHNEKSLKYCNTLYKIENRTLIRIK